MDNPDTWAIIWLVVAAGFGAGEIVVAGSFFLMPFAIGGLVASVAMFLGAPIIVGWLIFLVVSIVAFLGLKPFAAKLDEQLPNPSGFGSNRLIGSHAIVAESIPGGASATGLVRVGGEQWRAAGRDGMGIPEGTDVTILEVRGTRVIVEPTSKIGLSELG